MLVLVPVALILEFTHTGGPTAIFLASAFSLIPLAGLLGQATEEVAGYTGPKIGGLLNATLGNAAELIITIVALREGLVDVVKASIAGSIIGNILIVLGASVLLGGLKHGEQKFDARIAGVNATMMMLAVVALIVPAVFARGDTTHHLTTDDLEHLSDGVAVVMIVMYALYLIFTLRSSSGGGGHHEEAAPGMSLPM